MFSILYFLIFVFIFAYILGFLTYQIDLIFSPSQPAPTPEPQPPVDKATPAETKPTPPASA